MANASGGDRGEAVLLDVTGVCKRYPGVVALDDVDLTLRQGEVLAVIGENGAGKSTLMKVLAGVVQLDRGEIVLKGQRVEIASVNDAMDCGIALIHQELNLADNLDVGANIFLGREPQLPFLKLVDRRRIEEASKRHLEELGLSLSPRVLVRDLSVGQQQMVEIAKALSVDARILIMDEPTSSLSQREAEQLFRVIRGLRDRGVSVIYISHRLSEVREIADRVTVLRDGRNAGELGRNEIDHDRMVALMVGRDIRQFYDHRPRAPGDVVLEVRGLRVAGSADHDIEFELRSGEIVGLAGLVGAGRTEMIETLFGVRQPLAGEIRIAGRKAEIREPRDAIRAGLALVPEDRKLQGLVLEMAIRENVTLAGLDRYQKAGFLEKRRERDVAREMVERLAIRAPGVEQAVVALSGGNQQKVVLAKWLSLKPRILLLDEPTRGVDVGAKEEIYRLMENLAEDGVATLMVSSEMEEILGMSDRVVVMHEGRISGELRREELSEEAVMQLATGRSSAA